MGSISYSRPDASRTDSATWQLNGPDAESQQLLFSVLAGAMIATMLDLGSRTGLTHALAAGPADGAALAERTGGDRRIATEWLRCLATAGFAIEISDGIWQLSRDADALTAPAGSPWDLSPLIDLFS